MRCAAIEVRWYGPIFLLRIPVQLMIYRADKQSECTAQSPQVRGALLRLLAQTLKLANRCSAPLVMRMRRITALDGPLPLLSVGDVCRPALEAETGHGLSL